MKQIQLKDLYHECQRIMKEGKGEKYLILSDDNEGNGYHGMFYTLLEVTKDNKDDIGDLIGDNAEPDLENLIVVG